MTAAVSPAKNDPVGHRSQSQLPMAGNYTRVAWLCSQGTMVRFVSLHKWFLIGIGANQSRVKSA